MKNVFFCLSLLFASSASLASPVKGTTKTLEAFSFKGIVAGVASDPSTVGTCSTTDIPDEMKCRGKDNTVAGIELTLAPSYSFYKNRLTGMIFLFDNKELGFSTLASAFRERYGAPCKSVVEKWQNRAGATFDNPKLTWCFKTGEMELVNMSANRDYGHVIYIDQYSAPATATPKDF